MELKTVSNSSLGTYESCPQKYLHSYVRKLWPEKKALALGIGSAIHEILGKMYEQKRKKIDLTLAQATDIFLQYLNKTPIELKGKTPAVVTLEYTNIIRTILKNPLEVKPKYVEKFFEVDFINPFTKEKLNPRLRGVIDLVTEDDEIVEHKTSSKKYTEEIILNSKQHVGYFVGFCNIYHRQPLKIIYDIIYKTKNPNIDIFEIMISEHDVKVYFDWARKLIEEIESEDWTADPEFLKCRFCDFKNICAFSHA